MTEVVIEEAEAVLTGGYIPWVKEKFPFSKLTNSVFTDDTKTVVKGPSFVIPKADNPVSTLAAGRKRFKHCQFISRKVSKDGDVRVWLHPDSPLPANKPTSGVRAVETKPQIASKPKTPAKPKAPVAKTNAMTQQAKSANA